ncbi:MAG: hypothetical protein JO345_06715 [Streptosporangiaceae bacterium]|nr:hypothetical protein [Streptosporangiaceae bacterium]
MLADSWQQNRLTFLVGPAGRGKTSLLHAGVLRSLTASNLHGGHVFPVGRLSYGAAFPSAALPGQNPFTLALLRSWSPGETTTRLAGLTIREFIRRQVGKHVILAAIDPADELVVETGRRKTHRRLFLEELREALDPREKTETSPRLHLLVAGREEAIDVVTDALGNGRSCVLTKLTQLGTREAITRPMAAPGKSFSEEGAERFLTDLRTSRIAADDGSERYVTDDRVEPALLQIACAHLWASLPADVDFITARDVRRYGDVDTALAAHSSIVIAEVADEHEISTKRLNSWLVSTFITEHGARNKVYEGATATAGIPNAVVRALEDRYLLTSRLESGIRWYELSSDRLIEPLRRTADAHPPIADPAHCLQAAEHALTLGELDLTERYANEVLRKSSGSSTAMHAEAQSLLGNVAFARDEPSEAETHYRQAAELFGAASDTQAVAYQLAAVGQTLLTRERFTEAAEELNAAASRLPNDLVIQTELAHALWQVGASHAAVAVLTRALGIDGGNVAALQTRGEILADLGQAREAMLDLERVDLERRPSTRAARGLAHAELGDQWAARQDIEEAVARAQRNGPVLLYAARASRVGGDESAARDYARQAAIATDPPLSPQHLRVAMQLAGSARG